MRRTRVVHRWSARTLIHAGLAAQLVGVATQGLWHGLLAERGSGLLDDTRTFWVDHALSNAGVATLLVGGVLLHRRDSGTGTRIVLAGASTELLGALLDGYAHLRGAESHLAFALIGIGFLTATGGAVAVARARRRIRSDCAPAGEWMPRGSVAGYDGAGRPPRRRAAPPATGRRP